MIMKWDRLTIIDDEEKKIKEDEERKIMDEERKIREDEERIRDDERKIMEIQFSSSSRSLQVYLVYSYMIFVFNREI